MKSLIAILLSCSQLLFAADISTHWNDLAHLIVGKTVLVGLPQGNRVKGRVVSVEAGSLTVETGGGRQSVQRESVREIRVSSRSGYKWRLIGTAVGAGVGTAIAIPVLSETHNEGSSNYDAAAVGIIAGLAAVGYLVGWSTDRHQDVIKLLPDSAGIRRLAAANRVPDRSR
jgi:hypothetical protein